MLFRSNDTATTEIYTLSLHDALPILAFWRMFDALYVAPDQLSDRQLIGRAAALGLPSAELEPAWGTHRFIPRVKEDFLGGVDSGVTGTPGFFINGVRHEGSWDEVALTRALEAAAHLSG